MFFLYILKGDNNHIYVGVTKNIERRIQRHKNGSGAEFTFRNKVYRLVYQEKHNTLIEARRREKQVKGWSRKKKENLVRYGKPVMK